MEQPNNANHPDFFKWLERNTYQLLGAGIILVLIGWLILRYTD